MKKYLNNTMVDDELGKAIERLEKEIEAEKHRPDYEDDYECRRKRR